MRFLHIAIAGLMVLCGVTAGRADKRVALVVGKVAYGHADKLANAVNDARGMPQKVILYEEEPTNPTGTQFIGTVIWSTERVNPGPGQKLAIRADVEIPERKMSMSLSLRHDDKGLPASHTVEILFKLLPDFAHGSIGSIPGILMKQDEATRGAALDAGVVKVTNNHFLVGLSAAESAMQRNVKLLKAQSWLSVPIVYGDGKRALIVIQKGAPGERAFSGAFATWQ